MNTIKGICDILMRMRQPPTTSNYTTIILALLVRSNEILVILQPISLDKVA